MEPTKLLYLENHSLLECQAVVMFGTDENDNKIIVLDQTVFYPQGGGQPYDVGLIKSDSATFVVEEVRFIDGIVKHIGHYDAGTFSIGEGVNCFVEKDRRELHSRLHSAGHLVDMAMKDLGVTWIPGKGYHFPQGPYVEYAGSLDGVDVEKFKKDLEEKANEIVQRNDEVTIGFMPKEEMGTVCDFVPDYLPEGKPARVVMYGKFGIPCGGTHVDHLKDIRHMTIRKIKKEKDNVRVAYDVDR